jgi:hypothetical protein
VSLAHSFRPIVVCSIVICPYCSTEYHESKEKAPRSQMPDSETASKANSNDMSCYAFAATHPSDLLSFQKTQQARIIFYSSKISNFPFILQTHRHCLVQYMCIQVAILCFSLFPNKAFCLFGVFFSALKKQILSSSE